MDCTKPYTGIIIRLESLPAQEKPAMAATPRPPSSPCLTVVMMVPLACWREFGAESRKISLAYLALSISRRKGVSSSVLRRWASMYTAPAICAAAVAPAAPATPKGPTRARSSKMFITLVATTARSGVLESPQPMTHCFVRS